ncbi:MAG: divalent-cation tolerance protein CutA [Pseudomonadota bacterium]
MEYRLLYMTVPTREEARKIADALVEARLVACTNLIDGMESVYWWQGRIVRDNEVVLIAKTRAALVEPAIAKVKALHSYTVPCVIALPIQGGNPAYLAWLADETTAPQNVSGET